EDDLKAARDARDQGWLLVRGLYVDGQSSEQEDLAHRFAPDGRIADAYEQRVREADQSADLMRAHVRESTELSLLRDRKADLEAKRTEAAAAINALGARREAIRSEWRALWPAGLITVQLPGEMTEWLAQRSAVIAAAGELAEEGDAIAERVEREREARQALAATIAAFAVELQDGGLEALRERARAVLHEV